MGPGLSSEHRETHNQLSGYLSFGAFSVTQKGERRPLERHVQAGIMRLFRACGGVVFSTSQGYRHEPGGTRMTPGLSDLIVFFGGSRISSRTLFWEVKAPGGKRTPAQRVFGDHALMGNSFYGWGGMDEALGLMQSWGLIKGEHVA